MVTKPRTYEIQLNEAQAHILVDALDLWSRLHCAQLYELFKVTEFGRIGMEPEVQDRAEDLMLHLKWVLFPQLKGRAEHSILSPKIRDEARVAYDMLKVIREAVLVANGHKAADIRKVGAEDLICCTQKTR